MDRIQGTRKASKFAPEDFISNMPDIAITNIMDRLPLQDAVKTSILARNWRFKWTMLTQLVFDESFFKYLLKRKVENDHVRIISRFLLHLRGAITKFVLSIDNHVLDAADISYWILFLMSKGIKDLTLIYRDETPLPLPTHLFSCLELTHLKLDNCCFDPPPSFHGFPNLSSLELSLYKKSTKLGELFTGCPLLEILNLHYLDFSCNLKLVEIAKLENLKMLSLSLYDLDPEITSSTTIFELLASFPKLQELHLNFQNCELTEGAAIKRLPTTYPSVKALKLSHIELKSDTMLSCFIEMVRSFPNLQTLVFKANNWDDLPTNAICSLEVDYNTMCSLQLQSVMFSSFKGSEHEVCLMKYLLACSPFLKKIVINPHSRLELKDKWIFATKLLKLLRASPLAEISIEPPL